MHIELGLILILLFILLLQTKQVKACDNQQPLLTAGDDLKAILKGVCELMSVQRLATKVHNGSDLQSILEQNIVDSCHWVSGSLSMS